MEPVTGAHRVHNIILQGFKLNRNPFSSCPVRGWTCVQGNDLQCRAVWLKLACWGLFRFPCFFLLPDYTTAVNANHKSEILEVMVYYNCCDNNPLISVGGFYISDITLLHTYLVWKCIQYNSMVVQSTQPIYAFHDNWSLVIVGLLRIAELIS